jgi:hypothetical protein
VTTRIPASFLSVPALLGALALPAAACGRADARDNGSGERPRSAAEVVHNGKAGAWKPGEAWRLKEELRLGSADEGPDAFGRIGDVEADALGRVWVADGQAGEIRVFDAAGRHVRTVGRRGSGPGEFQQIAGMEFAPDGKLWVVDLGNARYSVFDTAGALVATHPRRGGAALIPWTGGFDRQGRLYDAALVARSPTELETALVRWDAGLARADTLRLPAYEPPYFEAGGGGPVSRINVPFTGQQVWVLDPSGDVWLGITDRYRFDRMEFAGGTVRALEKKADPVPVTRTDVDRVLYAYADFERQGGKIDRSRIPGTRPPVFGAFTSPDGHLWVAPVRKPGESAGYDVFDADGRFLGFVRLPFPMAITPPPVVRGDALYGVVRDSLGVESVARFRIEMPR